LQEELFLRDQDIFKININDYKPLNYSSLNFSSNNPNVNLPGLSIIDSELHYENINFDYQSAIQLNNQVYLINKDLTTIIKMEIDEDKFIITPSPL